MNRPSVSITLYSTCPQSKDVSQPDYARRVSEVARWSEEAGCHGMLVYTDNGIADPWPVAQHVIATTEKLRPLIAVQPVYMHPYTAAKTIATLAFLHERGVDLNLLAGGFRNDLLALGDAVAHDDRYARTVEYATILRRLVEGEGAVTVEGRFYQVSNLRLTPSVPGDLRPGLLISGSSPAGLEAAREIGATAVRYPQPPEDEDPELGRSGLAHGLRVGIIARDDPAEAWMEARARFPEDRRGRLTHELAMKVSDSHWHKALSEREEGGEGDSPYWLHPFKSYGTFCPYLVGSYDRVAAEVARYVELGFGTLITDIPRAEDDLHHVRRVLDTALELVAA